MSQKIEIRFYHLQQQSLDQVLPAILQKAYQGDHKIHVRLSDEAEVERMNKHLWTFKQDVFLPHGSKKDGHAEKQPVWLSSKSENPNKANVIFLTQGTTEENLDDYTLCCEMLDGRDESAIKEARKRWKKYQDAGLDVTYWHQNSNSGWDKKA